MNVQRKNRSGKIFFLVAVGLVFAGILATVLLANNHRNLDLLLTYLGYPDLLPHAAPEARQVKITQTRSLRLATGTHGPAGLCLRRFQGTATELHPADPERPADPVRAVEGRRFRPAGLDCQQRPQRQLGVLFLGQPSLQTPINRNNPRSSSSSRATEKTASPPFASS